MSILLDQKKLETGTEVAEYRECAEKDDTNKRNSFEHDECCTLFARTCIIRVNTLYNEISMRTRPCRLSRLTNIRLRFPTDEHGAPPGIIPRCPAGRIVRMAIMHFLRDTQR